MTKRSWIIRYCSSAAVLGVGWFLVLLIPRITRDWLLANALHNVLCLVVASIIVAVRAENSLGARIQGVRIWSERS